MIAWQNCLYGPFDIFNIRVKIGYHNDLTYVHCTGGEEED